MLAKFNKNNQRNTHKEYTEDKNEDNSSATLRITEEIIEPSQGIYTYQIHINIADQPLSKETTIKIKKRKKRVKNAHKYESK